MKIFETSGNIPEKVRILKSSYKLKDEISGKDIVHANVHDETSSVPNTIVINNEPVSNVRLFMNERNMYMNNVIINDDYMIYSSQDFLFNTIKYSGIKKNGKLNGEYKWAKRDRSFFLVETSSPLYSALERSTARVGKTVIKKEDLKAGEIYVSSYGKCRLFLGPIKTLINRNIKKQRYVDRLLWLDLNKNDDPEEKLENVGNNKAWGLLRELTMNKRHEFVDVAGSVTLKPNHIEKLRKISTRLMAGEPSYQNQLFEFCHMHDPNDQMPPAPEYSKLLNLI